jgi:hypothetical protein
MKQLFAFFPFILLLSCCSSTHEADDNLLFPYWNKGGGFLSKYKYKAGYMNLSGDEVIDNIFIYAEPFTEGLGCVAIHNDDGVFYGYIDNKANFVIQPRFKLARPFHNNRALVWESDNVGWAVINRKGEFITEKIFETYTTNYYEGHCFAYVEQGTEEASKMEKAVTGIITMGLFPASDHIYYNCYKLDTTGKAELIEANTERTAHGNVIGVREQNNLAVFREDESGPYGFRRIQADEYEPGKLVYTAGGNIIIEPTYKNAENFQYGYARVEFENGDKGYIDTTGKVVLRFSEDRPY